MGEKRNNHYVLWIVYLNVALYATCYQIQRPVEPFLVEKLKVGGSNEDAMKEYALLQSFFSLLQTGGSLISGTFVDIFGVKGGFYISFGASALCYWMLSHSTSLYMLYASKIPSIFQAGFLCAQVAASQSTMDGPDRVRALGLLTTSYTIGSVIGPTLGGYLGASGDYYFGATIAVYGSLLSMVLTFFLPSDLVNSDHKIDAKPSSATATAITEGGGKNQWNFQTITNILSTVWLFLTAKVISSTANAMSMTAFPLVLKQHFLVDEQGLGYAMSLLSACNAIVNGLLLGPLVKLIGGGDLMVVIKVCLMVMMSLFGLQALLMTSSTSSTTSSTTSLSYQLPSFLITHILLSVFQYILATSITSESTSRVAGEAKGTLLGLEHSLFAAARIITPQLGITLLQQGGISLVSFTCAMVYAVVGMVWYRYHITTPAPAKITSNSHISNKQDTERKEK